MLPEKTFLPTLSEAQMKVLGGTLRSEGTKGMEGYAELTAVGTRFKKLALSKIGTHDSRAHRARNTARSRPSSL
jgi:hypothetical protein